MLSGLEKRISINRDRLSVFTISYSDGSRETALAVTKSLLDTFIEDTLGRNTEESDVAARTLRAQIEEYERRLTA